MIDTIYDVGERDEDGMCLVVIRDAETRDELERLYLRFDEVGDFVASEREMQAMSEQAHAEGMTLCEYALQPFGPEWEREQMERY